MPALQIIKIIVINFVYLLTNKKLNEMNSYLNRFDNKYLDR
jgi:hypothetical protein